MNDKLQKIIIAGLKPYLPDVLTGIYPEGNASAADARYPFVTVAVNTEEIVKGNYTVKASVEFSVVSDPVGDVECANTYAAALTDAVVKAILPSRIRLNEVAGSVAGYTIDESLSGEARAKAIESEYGAPYFYTGLVFERQDSPAPETFGNDDVFRTVITYGAVCQF